MEGRDRGGRFAPGFSPDRGRGRLPARPQLILDEEMRRIVMECANLPVSIPRGRGRRVVTLYEALVRRLAAGGVYGRSSVIRFIRLVQEAAGLTPEPVLTRPPPAITRLQDHLDQLRAAAGHADSAQNDQAAVTFFELLLDTVRQRQRP